MPLFIGLILLVIDQIVKLYVDSTMHLGQSIPIIKNYFYITYVLNPGAAFGILENQRYFFILIALIILIATGFAWNKLRQQTACFRYGAGLLVSGSVGNLIDRIRSGLVVDFLDFRVWPVFNIADIAICVGCAMMIFAIFREDAKAKARA